MPSYVQIFVLMLSLFMLHSTIAQQPRARRVFIGKSSPLVLHLPIYVKTHNNNNNHDNQPQPSENENLRQSGYFPFQGQQRLVMRTYDPEEDEDEEREHSSDEDNESTEGRNSDAEEPERYPKVDFLRWNGRDRGMLLNIKDYFELGAGGQASTVSSEEEEEEELEEEEEAKQNEEPEEWPEERQLKNLQYSSVKYLPPSSSSVTSRLPERSRKRNYKPGTFFQGSGPFRYIEQDDDDDDEDDIPPSEFLSPRGRKHGYEQGSGNFEGLSGGVYGSHPIESFFKENSRSAKKPRRRGHSYNRGHPNPYRQFDGFSK